MAVGDNSYGTVAEVQALCPRVTFGETSIPTSTQVEQFIDRVSAIINVLLAREGFAIPVTQADCLLALDEFVVQEAVDLVDAVLRMGRFFSDKVGARSKAELIRKDARDFIEDNSLGFELLGATRSYNITAGLDFNATDDAGNLIEPIFDRKMMHQSIIDWDPE